ncbi:hypothetical protein MBEHAL_0378 [Halarchaeum acidiphilum MH1-52-1]|uniref:Uncharacterized protein n=1 Tax=Halarchaeum acidiphilum MH1-52-1 TaxID=1261545 RepID=U3AA28_9EURY|nr:hypothetical protein [Halarchaeum acidiphilum]GAD51618.1 hypothetical protein MBEHAL_0378 [Halarchaeum acidiphilum MH1-52-1]
MSHHDFLVRAVAAAVCWLCLVTVAAAVIVGGVFGTYPGPYGGAAVVVAALAVACVAGALLVTGVPARARSE